MLKILHFSSHYEDCGIAKYQENYIDAIAASSDEIENVFFESSPYQTREMNAVEFDEVILKLEEELRDYDILHIQHEFGFYRGNQLQKIVDTAKRLNKKILVTYHTSPDLIIIKKRLTGLGPRSIISYLRSYRHNLLLQNIHIKPLLSANKVLVHNQYTLDRLAEFGVPKDQLVIIPHPTYNVTNPPKTTAIAEALHKQKGDIIYGCVGYLHRFKGIDKAIKALKFLPPNYKLAVLGGVKSDSDDQKIYDKLTDLVVTLGLEDRVYISGVIQSDEELNSYIRETDLCVYPYNSKYYKGVASGALNLAIANERPIVAYPVSTFVETNEAYGQIMFTDSDSYYELAREIQRLNIPDQTKKIAAYAKANSYMKISQDLTKLYSNL